MKTNCCIIAIQRYEPYLKYWIDYHLNYGISHIFLLDNNDVGDSLYLDRKYKDSVTILPCNYITNIAYGSIQCTLYQAVLEFIKKSNSTYSQYTHCLVIDIDEYFYSPKYSNINDFIDEQMNADTIAIRWQNYGDNEYIYKAELPFDNPIENYTSLSENKYNITIEPKSIAKIESNTILGVHWHNYKYGKNTLDNPDIAVIKHYRTGCVEEYLDKCIKRRTNNALKWYNYGKDNMKVFFNYNKITQEKLNAFVNLYKQHNIELSETDKELLKTYSVFQ